eukprot:TRINITY_DN35354_c0_g1_i1.p1 TRINITY_DN35354_c0_g1~~TRINITY_DN35354_c0_g1_i1.p1  ORF type:complete len:826 (+),score=244.40 TRINITY_DN35354_c0_g1_i1:102-2579(+)
MGRSAVAPVSLADAIGISDAPAPALAPAAQEASPSGSPSLSPSPSSPQVAARRELGSPQSGSPGEADDEAGGEEYGSDDDLTLSSRPGEKKQPRILAVGIWLLAWGGVAAIGATNAASARGGVGLSPAECTGPVTLREAHSEAERRQLGVPPAGLAPGVAVAAVLVTAAGAQHAWWANIGCSWHDSAGRLTAWRAGSSATCARPEAALLSGAWPLLTAAEARLSAATAASRAAASLQQQQAAWNRFFASPMPCVVGGAGALGAAAGEPFGRAAMLSEPSRTDQTLLRGGIATACIGVAAAALCLVRPLRRRYALHAGRGLRRCVKHMRTAYRKLRSKTRLKHTDDDVVGVEADAGGAVAGTQGTTRFYHTDPRELYEQQQKGVAHPRAINDAVLQRASPTEEKEKGKEQDKEPSASPAAASRPVSRAASAASLALSPDGSKALSEPFKIRALHNWQSRRQSEMSFAGPRASDAGSELGGGLDGADIRICASEAGSRSSSSRVSEKSQTLSPGVIPPLPLAGLLPPPQAEAPGDSPALPPLALGTLARRPPAEGSPRSRSPRQGMGRAHSVGEPARLRSRSGGRGAQSPSGGARDRGLRRTRSEAVMLTQWRADGSAEAVRVEHQRPDPDPHPPDPLTPRGSSPRSPGFGVQPRRRRRPDDTRSEGARSAVSARSAASRRSRRSLRRTPSAAPPSRMDLMASETGTGTKRLAPLPAKWDATARSRPPSPAGSAKSAPAKASWSDAGRVRRSRSVHASAADGWAGAKHPEKGRRRSLSGSAAPVTDVGLLEKCYELSRAGAVEHLSRLDTAVRETEARKMRSPASPL